MSRRRSSTLKLCTNSRGYLFVRGDDGRQIWFGHDSKPESHEKYAAFLAARHRQEDADEKPTASKLWTVSEICLRYVADHASRYKTSTGEPSAEFRCIKGAVKLLREQFGGTLAKDFGPLRFRIVRQAMIDKGWSRPFVNKQCVRIRSIFRYAVGFELVHQSVVESLKAVSGLQPGESAAPETTPRRAVSQEHLDAVRRRLRQRNRDLVDLMLLTGCRPGELPGLTTSMIDRTGEIWRCELQRHKTRHRGKQRTLLFNATAQAILERYLRTDAPTERLFPVRGDTFSASIKAACVRAKIPVFTPHWLRHTVASRLVDTVGLEATQQLLGHCGAAMTEHYSRAAERQAVERLG